jgi:hypothetical protein
MDRWVEPPNLSRCAKMRSKDDGAGPRSFFFLAGLALVMVWLTQQLWL